MQYYFGAENSKSGNTTTLVSREIWELSMYWGSIKLLPQQNEPSLTLVYLGSLMSNVYAFPSWSTAILVCKIAPHIDEYNYFPRVFYFIMNTMDIYCNPSDKCIKTDSNLDIPRQVSTTGTKILQYNGTETCAHFVEQPKLHTFNITNTLSHSKW